MRIINRKISIKIVDQEKFILTALFSPFDFLPLNMSEAVITVNIDNKEQVLPWKMNEGKIMWFLKKIGGMTNHQIFARAKVVEGEIILSERMEVMIRSLSISCSEEQLTSETPWEKEARLKQERIKQIFEEAKPFSIEELAGKSPT